MAHEKNQQLIDGLNNCVVACEHCTMACLGEQDVKMLSRCIRLDLDCAAVCRLAVTLVARGSENANRILAECADICDACANECEQHAHMEHCKQCAEACRVCAELCAQGAEV